MGPRATWALRTTLERTLISRVRSDLTEGSAIHRFVIFISFKLSFDRCDCFELLLLFSIGIANLQHRACFPILDDLTVERCDNLCAYLRVFESMEASEDFSLLSLMSLPCKADPTTHPTRVLEDLA